MAAEDYFDIGDYDEMSEADDSITNEEEEKDYIQMLHDGNCVAPVVLRRDKKGQTFWGCAAFPEHRWTHRRLK